MKTITKEPKIFFNEHGFFYEGQTLEQYCYSKGQLVYSGDVKIIKFITHYDRKTHEPEIYFRFGNFYNKVEYTLSCDYLGKFYKIKRNL